MCNKCLERAEDEYNRRDDSEEPEYNKCQECKDHERSLELEIKSLKAQITRDAQDYNHFLQRIITAFGYDYFNGSADEQVNIIASINNLRKTPGKLVDETVKELQGEAEAQRRNFEEQCDKVSGLEYEMYSLKSEKESLLHSIAVKDRKHREEMKECDDEIKSLHDEMKDVLKDLEDHARAVTICHELLDDFKENRIFNDFDFGEPYEALWIRIEKAVLNLDPEYREYTRLKEKFEQKKSD